MSAAGQRHRARDDSSTADAPSCKGELGQHVCTHTSVHPSGKKSGGKRPQRGDVAVGWRPVPGRRPRGRGGGRRPAPRYGTTPPSASTTPHARPAGCRPRCLAAASDTSPAHLQACLLQRLGSAPLGWSTRGAPGPSAWREFCLVLQVKAPSGMAFARLLAEGD